MVHIYKLLLLTLLTTTVVSAREFTQPPSVALRSEISFVAEVMLDSKKYVDTDKWQLKFVLNKDLHNTSQVEILTTVSSNLAQSLATKAQYIIAYSTHRKTKVNGLVEYQLLPNGPRLITVEGANPAIFRSNELLKKQILTDPKMAQSDPVLLINAIMTGMDEKDPKIQEFFVRELINWIGLLDRLTEANFEQLFKVFNSTEASTGTLIAMLENRIALHQSMGIKRMGVKVTKLLEVLPTNMDPSTEQPALVLQALNFINNHAIGNWTLYSRWTGSNISAITEKATLSLHEINAEKTAELVKIRLAGTLLSDSSRRVLNRYFTNINTKTTNDEL